MFTEKNFKNALEVMKFEKISDGVYQKNFAENISMQADFNQKKFFYPKNLKIGRDTIKNFSQNENFVVFECVHRLLQKGYKPEDIFLEKSWQLGHNQKSGRADICISKNEKVFLIIECKTFGAEFNRELENLKSDGGQLFSYRQQEISCEWLILYASDFAENKIIFNSKSVSCHEEIYNSAKNVQDFFKIWSEKFNKQTADDVIFHDETVAYQIGVKPFRKKDLQEFKDTSIVNKFKEILRHNDDSAKERAFDVLLSLFICKIFDEIYKSEDNELEFQFKIGVDDEFSFEGRLRNLHKKGMLEFMNKKIYDTSDSDLDKLFFQFQDTKDNELVKAVKKMFREQKFFTSNHFSFIDIDDEELFYQNSKILHEVVDIFKYYRLIGAKNLQILGDLFEQLLDKGFKQDEGKFFTPLPITRFIWDSLPLEKIIISEKFLPKIIDYACGAGHFLTQGFEAIKDFCKNLSDGWENEKIFGIEKDNRLAKVSKISFFMHGANNGKIKRGDGLENYPDEGISAESFDILVSNPPYSVKDFKQHLNLKNNFETLEKISLNGSEIETLFVERISQLLKPGGISAVILPSSILNKDGGSFVCSREKILQNFYLKAIAEFGSKTFSSTGTKTNILFLEKISNPPEKFNLFSDTVNRIFSQNFSADRIDEEIFNAWLKKIKIDKKIYQKFISRELNCSDWKTYDYFANYVTFFENSAEYKNKISQSTFQNLSDAEKIEWFNQKFYDFAQKIEREKIQYFAITYTQKTLIISAPDKNDEQEKFLGYEWSTRKRSEGIKIKSEGGLLFDKNNRRAENKLAYAVRKIFSGEEVEIPDAEKYFNYFILSDLIDFSGTNFTKIIKTVQPKNFEVKDGMKIFKLSSADFEIKIGDRVLSSEIISDGKIPVYSANVFEEFGRINKQNLTDFSLPSIIWGIDGDWMVNLIPAGKIFYPTDHCGVLRIKTSEIIPEYFKFILKIAGDHEKFSRTNRASIARIKNLTVQIHSLDEQKKIVLEFAAIDEKISDCEEKISACDESIKNKFLEMFLQKDFPREKLGNFIKQIRGVSYKPEDLRENLNENSLILLRANNIRDGEINHDEIQFVSKEKVSAEQIIREGDILISASSGSLNHVGKSAICSEKISGETFGAFCKIIRATGELSAKFISIYFLTEEYREKIMQLASGANINNLKNEHIDNLKIPVPPKEKQEEFAEYVLTVEGEKNNLLEEKKILTLERAALAEKYFR